MNHTPVTGWYYRSVSDRSASWTGVEYLFNFLTNNKSVEPTILVAAHTYDALDRPLDTYEYEMVRFLHIDGVRAW